MDFVMNLSDGALGLVCGVRVLDDFGARNCEGLGLCRGGRGGLSLARDAGVIKIGGSRDTIKRLPVFGRNFEVPKICRLVEFDGGLEEAASLRGTAGILYAAARGDGLGLGVFGRELQDHDGVVEDLVLRFVFAPVAANDGGGDVLAVRTTGAIYAHHSDGYGMIEPRAAARGPRMICC